MPVSIPRCCATIRRPRRRIGAAHRGGIRALAARALYGETDGTRSPEGYPHRTYRWVDRVPAGLTVVIGHDVVSTNEIVRRRGAQGGELVHLDTGVDRGGRLSFLDIPAGELRTR